MKQAMWYADVTRRARRMSDPIILRKYASRRLYNTQDSSYVTLGQVADIIRSGTDVCVIDAKTGEDVTAYILTQIILEEARKKNALLPPSLLHLIVRTGGTVLQDFFAKHLQDAINAYLQLRKTFEEQFSMWLNMGMNYPGTAGTGMKGMPSADAFSRTWQPEDRPPGKKARKKRGA